MSRLSEAFATVGRTMATTLQTIPFTPATYDTAFRNSTLPGLPPIADDGHLALPAAYACTIAVSDDTAVVPFQMFEQRGDSKRLAREHPVYDLLQHQANAEDTAIDFRSGMTAVAMNRGRAVAEIKAGPRGAVDQLIQLHPDRIRTERRTDGTKVLIYQDPERNGAERTITRDQLFILRGRLGVGVLTFARRNFELQLAMQQMAREMYGRGLRSAGYLSVKEKLDPEQRSDLREALNEYQGTNERAGRPLLLDAGAEWKTISISLEDAEFLATLQHGVGDVCRWYRVPKHKAQELAPGTHASLQQLATDYVVDSLLGWTVRWEQAARRDLILNQRFFAEHNLEGLLKGDIATRFEAYKIAITFGWMTRAEVRDKENMNPIPGLDKPLLPLNMAAQVSGGSPGAGAIAPSSAAVVSYLRTLVRDGAARIVRKEAATLGKLAEKGDGWESGVRDFYREHAEWTAKVLRIPDEVAEQWAQLRAKELIERGPEALADPETSAVADLTELALDKSTALAIPGERPLLPPADNESVLGLAEVTL